MTGQSRAAATSVVNAPLQIEIAILLAAATAWFVGLTGPAWCAIAAGLVVVVTGWQMSIVRVAVGAQSVVLAQGRFGRPRVIPIACITGVEVLDLGWVQIFGFGMRTRWRTTRLTVRPGRTLCVHLTDGEVIRVSIAAADVADVLTSSTKRETSP